MRSVEQLFDDLCEQRFHLDFSRIELQRSRDGNLFIGPGYIRQKVTRDFEIKIYAKDRVGISEFFKEFQSVKSGVLYEKNDHYHLSATDIYGKRWTAEGIVNPEPSGHFSGDGHIVGATCNELALTKESLKQNSSSLWLKSLAPIRFPCNMCTEETTRIGKQERRGSSLNVAKFMSNGFDFLFEDDQNLSVSAVFKGQSLPARATERITEAVAFTLGTMPLWTMHTCSDGGSQVTRFQNHKQPSRKSTPWPPYRVEPVDNTGSIWGMFDRYLAYVLQDTENQIHPLSRWVFSIGRTRDSSLEGLALTLAVAVESVLDQFYKDIGQPTSTYVKAVEELIEHLVKWDGDNQVISRAKGSISNMKSARADDRLRQLVKDGVIFEKDRGAWKKLRNAATHGRWDFYGDSVQELLDLTGTASCLFNRLVFYLIGYSGMQTDYGSHGWPTVDYPPASASNQTEVKNE